MKVRDTGGPLSLAFARFVDDGRGLTPPMIEELRRAYYAGAAFVIGTVDEAESAKAAAHAMLIIKAEATHEEPPP